MLLRTVGEYRPRFLAFPSLPICLRKTFLPRLIKYGFSGKRLILMFNSLVEHTVCKSVHRFNEETGDSIYVVKTCAVPTECSSDKVGCTVNGNNEVVSPF